MLLPPIQLPSEKLYKYKAYYPETNQQIITLVKEAVGIRSISRILGISATTVIKRIKQIARAIQNPIISLGKTYQVDELKTYVRKKTNEMWITYALDRYTKTIAGFNIGKRTKKNLKTVITTLLYAKAKMITTDKLNIYRSIIPKEIHSRKYRGINHIERKNLSMRTHLRRLQRKSLCFSKSLAMLTACIKIYFWI